MTEDQIQVEMVGWFNNQFPEYRGRLFHVPNGGERRSQIDRNGQRFSLEAMKFQAMGVLPGVSDLILLWEQRIFFFEVKTERGVQSEAQKEFEARVVFLGFDYYIVRNLQQFKDKIWLIIGKSLLGGG